MDQTNLKSIHRHPVQALNTMRLEVPHFEEPDRASPVKPHAKISEALYGQALDYLVIACVDVVLTHQQFILLVKRNCYPRPSWWIPGGRMAAGEDPIATAQRKMKLEVGLADLDPTRFKYIGVYSTCFAHRHQPPEHHGAHTLNLTYRLEITATEKQQIRLSQEEHETWQWMKRDAIVHSLEAGNVMDQALLHVMQDLMQTER